MFKKFTEAEISGTQQLKSSVQKGIRNKLVENYPNLQDFVDDILPKKENFKVIKCKDHMELVANANGEVLFAKSRDTEYFPTLRLLHQYPFLLPIQQVDKGAIKFILSGAHIMCPGLTSPGAKMTPEIGENKIVAIMAEGKQHAVAVGLMKMSTEEVRSKNKGVGVDNLHYLNDGLWRVHTVR